MNKKSCIRIFADEKQLSRCKEDINRNQYQFEKLSEVLSLSGNAVRLKIIYLLNKEGKMCPCDLSDVLEMTVPAISQHLKKLKEASIVERNKVAQTVFYSISKEYHNTLMPILELMNNEH